VKGKVVIIGGGPNGLTAATLLARGGCEVHLFEARERFGGMAAPEVFHPGYTAPGLLDDTSGVRPWVLEALGLAQTLRRGPAAPRWVPSPGGGLTIAPEGLSGDVSEGDRAGWRAYRGLIEAARPVIERVMDQPALGVRDSLWSLAKTGWAVRRLGPATMHEVLRVLPMCVADWMRDTFESEPLSAALALGGLTGAYTGPWSAHTAANLLVREALANKPIEGGNPALIAALEGAARGAGANLNPGARVAGIMRRVDRAPLDAERAVGVVLADGREIAADAVLSTLDPKRTFLELYDPRTLPLRLLTDVRRYRMRGTTFKVHLALSGPLETASGDTPEALCVGGSLDAVERAWDAAKYRRFAESPALEVRVASRAVGGLCPEGHAVVSILGHAAAFDREGGWTDEARAALGEAALAALATACPGVRDRLVAIEVLSPRDVEARYGVSGGHILHGEHAPDQLLFLRPTLDTSRYSTPVEGLFLGGGAAHPGGGLTLAPGALAARAILAA